MARLGRRQPRNQPIISRNPVIDVFVGGTGGAHGAGTQQSDVGATARSGTVTVAGVGTSRPPGKKATSATVQIRSGGAFSFRDIVVILPLPPAVQPPAHTTYRYLLTDLRTGKIRDEIQLSGVKWGKVLNAPGSLTGYARLDDSRVTPDQLDVGATGILVERNGQLVWGGILWTAVADDKSRRVHVGAEGFWSYFQKNRRMLRSRQGMLTSTAANAYTYYPSGDSTKANFAGVPDNTNLFNNFGPSVNLGEGLIALSDTLGFYTAKANIANNALSGLTVAAVSVYTLSASLFGLSTVQPKLGIGNPSVEYFSPTVQNVLMQSFGFTSILWSWTTNPATGTKWVNTDVEKFSSQNTFGFNAGTDIVPDLSIFQLKLFVSWEATPGGAVFHTGIDQLEIARDYLRHAASFYGSLAFNIDSKMSGVVRDIANYGYERKSIGELVETLSKMDHGFDFSMDVAWAPGEAAMTPILAVNTYYPSKGSNKPYVFFDYGHPAKAINFKIDSDGSKLANWVDGIGAGSGELAPIASYADVGKLNHYLLLEGLIQQKQITDTDALAAATLAELTRRSLPLVSVDAADSSPDLWPDFSSYDVGDVVQVRASDGWITLNGMYRIIKIDITVLDDGREVVTPTFSVPELTQ